MYILHIFIYMRAPLYHLGGCFLHLRLYRGVCAFTACNAPDNISCHCFDLSRNKLIVETFSRKKIILPSIRLYFISLHLLYLLYGREFIQLVFSFSSFFFPFKTRCKNLKLFYSRVLGLWSSWTGGVQVHWHLTLNMHGG